MIDPVTKRVIGETKEEAFAYYRDKIFEGNEELASKMIESWPYESFSAQSTQSQKIGDAYRFKDDPEGYEAYKKQVASLYA